ncbi:MAG: tripartite tricarboxylate transporter substrate binding protein [Hydrogenophaga sp.]|nr:tripartite tricarboxylate transporter substrate binding protein [Hydrogenophaga sp.]
MDRRQSLAALLATTLAPAASWAQDFPSKPIKLIVAFGAGSGNDLIARELAKHMSESLAQPVVVENRPGGGGSVGTDAVAKAQADGHTIGLGTSSQMVMNVGLYKTLPFDVERDLRSVGLVARTGMILVASSKMPPTLAGLIAQAKAQPGKITYGSGGPGSISHIVGEAFAKAAGISLLHVPYKGNGPALADLAGGHVDLLFDGFLATNPLVQQGKAQILALSAPQRSAMGPQVPTFAEAGLPDYQAYTWNNLFAPAATPQPIIDRLNRALNQALAQPGLQQRLAQGGSEALGPSTPVEADSFGQRERARWVPFVRALNIETA